MEIEVINLKIMIAIVCVLAFCITLSVNAQDDAADRMNRGVWVAEIRDWKVIPSTIRRLGPDGTFYQAMINRAGTWVTFWGKEVGKKGADVWIAATDGSS